MAYIQNNLNFQKSINVSSDFPPPSLVKNGWFYSIASDVTDDDVTKTNTGLSFRATDEITWFNGTWIPVGEYTYVNNLINTGISGVSIIDSVVSKVASLRSIEAGSNKINVTYDPTNKAISIDLNNSNIDINSPSGILSIVKGGTGTSGFVNNSIVYLNGTSLSSVTIGTSGQFLQSTGNSAPIWISSSITNLNNSVVLRDLSGRTKFTDPVNNQDAATKNYVDTVSFFAKKYTTTVNGLSSSYVITHNLNTRDVIVNLYDSSTYEDIIAKITRTSVNSVTLDFNTVTYGSSLNVVIIGCQN